MTVAGDDPQISQGADGVGDASGDLVRLLLESTGEGIYGIDLEGRCTFANPACVAILGFDSDGELLGNNMHELVHHTLPDGTPYPMNECRIYKAFREGCGVHADDEVMWRRDGSSFPAEYWSYPMRRDGELVGSVLTFNDITERRRVESELLESQELSSLLLESTGEGIYGIDLEGRCTFANPACVRILGFDSDGELLGNNMHELVHHTRPDGAPYLMTECRIYKAFRNGRGVHADDEVMWRRDGTSFPAEYWSYPMRRDGELVGSVLTFSDITERRRVEERLHGAMDAAEQASAAKSQFMANMSHELRTPMNAILGYSEILMEDAEDAGETEMLEDLRKINAAGRHLLELINAVLDLSKIEAGRMDLHVEEVDVTDFLDGIVAVADPLVAKNDNEFAKEWTEDLGTICTDVTKLRQSLFNLLSNAAKFTHEGTITLAVRRAVTPGADRIVFAVSDTGTGIAADKLEHVFEEFAQAEETTSRDYGGTGLGLSLTRRLCRLMDGEVVLESELGVGSTFTIDLPCDAQPGGAVASSATRGAESVGREVDSWDVLVIDDDVHSRELLTRALEGEGYNVVSATGGIQGVSLARRLRPALITLDIVMPGMDGWAVLTDLKVHPETRDIPVVMLSIAPDRDMGYMLGAVESLTKPVDRSLLRKVVQKYMTADDFSVLIVDDDDSSRALLRRYAEAEGWGLAEADTGATALERIEETIPDLVLLDLMMPIMDGFEFIEEIQAREHLRHIPIVVVTAKTLNDDDRSRLRGNVERVIEKGQSTVDELLQYVAELDLGEPRST
jgi:PAS domain S-box-containing protein